MRCFVYYNLHKAVWSVKALTGEYKGKVIIHASSIVLDECQFKVSEPGRQRVLKEQRKNVHAGIVGDIVSYEGVMRYPATITLKESQTITTGTQRVRYNPYTGPYFMAGNTPVHYADNAVLTSERYVYISSSQ